MATIGNDSNGRRRVLFIDQDGSRKTVRLGKASAKQAEGVKALVESLQAVQVTGILDPTTAARVRDLSDDMHDRLARVGLVEPRQSMTLGGWLETYLADRTPQLKPESLRKLKATKALLLKHFPADLPLRKLTAKAASEWRAGLTQSLASIKTHSGNAKSIMAEALRRKLVPENLFDHLKSGATPSAYNRFITDDETARLIEAAPGTQWPLLIGLARYAGLRVPSETHLLTLGDVDFSRAKLTVRSPKTEGHEGHEQRIVPIDPRLMTLLDARFHEMGDGDIYLVSITGQGNMQRWLRKITKAAAVEPWKRTWQTLRSSCERAWAMHFPQFAVSKWIGHSMQISDRHYTGNGMGGVPEELFRRAAQNPAQSMPATAPNVPQRKRATPQERQETAIPGNRPLEVIGGGGNRTPVPWCFRRGIYVRSLVV